MGIDWNLSGGPSGGLDCGKAPIDALANTSHVAAAASRCPATARSAVPCPSTSNMITTTPVVAAVAVLVSIPIGAMARPSVHLASVLVSHGHRAGSQRPKERIAHALTAQGLLSSQSRITVVSVAAKDANGEFWA